MKALVAYKSKHGFTKGIADHIADTMRKDGVDAVAEDADKVKNPAEYDAFVIGSAVFYGKWMKEAREFVENHQSVLSRRPVWLFSSGPTGKATTDKRGRDLREASVPNDIANFKSLICPRDHHVFYGGFDGSQHGLGIRILRKSATIREAMQEGDYRNWPEIEEWASGIARDLGNRRDQPNRTLSLP
jgi:menaquinone-dependent protoporphyrinogen oxidase